MSVRDINLNNEQHYIDGNRLIKFVFLNNQILPYFTYIIEEYDMAPQS